MNAVDSRRAPRVIAIASGGGHWIQLLRLRTAFADARVTYVTVRKAYHFDVPNEPFHVIRDASRWNKFGLVIQLLQIAWIMIRVRPDCVITTGAAPGYWAIRIGRLLGARTCWIDSIANVEAVSMAGSMAGPHCDLWLTQWKDRAAPGGPLYRGNVIGAESVHHESPDANGEDS